MARITGIGGVFFKARDPKALAAWYRDVLGLAVEDWGGVMFQSGSDARMTLFVPFEASTSHFDPSSREFMINFTVDDLDGVLAMLARKGVEPLRRDDSDPNGCFAWILDPEGSKIELWEPKKT